MSKLVKRVLAGILIGASLSMVGCGNSNSETKQKLETSKKEEVKQEVETEEPTPVEEDKLSEKDIVPDILANEAYNKIKIDRELLAPNSIGTVYAQATLTNGLNKFAVTYASITYQYTNEEGKKDTTYMTFSDTIMPGETSPVAETFGSEDMEAVKMDITLKPLDLNMEYYIIYDFKLGTYEIGHRYL